MSLLHKPFRTGRLPRFVQFATALGGLALLAVLLGPTPAQAALPEIKVAPLHYAEHLEIGHPKTGFVDTSNPTGSPVHIRFEVQAFRQVNDTGELEFFDDERIASAVTLGLPEFDLGPREAVRTKFTIDPNKLGPGGAYGVIFARASPPGAAPDQVNTSARLGTLLMLDIGGSGTKSGRITGFRLPPLFYGAGTIAADYTYRNTGKGNKALAFTPSLMLDRHWFGGRQKVGGLFVFPGRERITQAKFTFANNLGPVPITLSDATGQASPATHWVFVVSGIWTWLLPLLIIALLYFLVRIFRRSKAGTRSRRYSLHKHN